MTRVLLLGRSSSLPHAARLVAVARALAAAGHAPVLAGEPRWLASSLLADRAELPRIALADPAVDLGGDGAAGADPATAFAGALDEDLRLVADVRPALVVVADRPSAVVAAEARRTPCLSLADAAALGPAGGVAPTVAEYGAALAAALGAPEDAVREARDELRGRAPAEVLAASPRPLPPGVAELAASVGARPRRWQHELALAARTAAVVEPALGPTPDAPGLTTTGDPAAPPAAAPPWWWGELGDAAVLVADVADPGDAAWGALVVERLAHLPGLPLVVACGEDAAPPGVRAAPHLPAPPRVAVWVTTRAASLARAARAGAPAVLVPATPADAIAAIPWVRAGVAALAGRDAAARGDARLAALVERLAADDGARARAAAVGARIDPAAAAARVVALAAELAAAHG